MHYLDAGVAFYVYDREIEDSGPALYFCQAAQSLILTMRPTFGVYHETLLMPRYRIHAILCAAPQH